MIKQYIALSIVASNAERIAKKIKTLEVRSWQPEMLPLKNLMIVENQNFLLNDGDEDVGFAVALVDIESVHPWNLMKLTRLVRRIGLKDIWLGSLVIFVRLIHRFKSLPSENFIVLN